MGVRVLLAGTRSWTSFNPDTPVYKAAPSVAASASTRQESESMHFSPSCAAGAASPPGSHPRQACPTARLTVSFHLLRRIEKRRGLETYDEAGDLSRAQTNDSCPCPHNRRNQSQHTNAMRFDKMRFRCRVNVNAQPSTRDDSDKPRCLELALVLPACGA